MVKDSGHIFKSQKTSQKYLESEQQHHNKYSLTSLQPLSVEEPHVTPFTDRKVIKTTLWRIRLLTKPQSGNFAKKIYIQESAAPIFVDKGRLVSFCGLAGNIIFTLLFLFVSSLVVTFVVFQ